jgi:hypothetical protein
VDDLEPRALYHAAAVALIRVMTNTTLSPNDRRLAWETARDDAHLAFRLWCHAPYGAKREAYAVYRAAADREDVAISALMTA